MYNDGALGDTELCSFSCVHMDVHVCGHPWEEFLWTLFTFLFGRGLSTDLALAT